VPVLLRLIAMFGSYSSGRLIRSLGEVGLQEV